MPGPLTGRRSALFRGLGNSQGAQFTGRFPSIASTKFLSTLVRESRRRCHMTNAAGTNAPAPTRCPLSVQERKTYDHSEYFRLWTQSGPRPNRSVSLCGSKLLAYGTIGQRRLALACEQNRTTWMSEDRRLLLAPAGRCGWRLVGMSLAKQ